MPLSAQIVLAFNLFLVRADFHCLINNLRSSNFVSICLHLFSTSDHLLLTYTIRKSLEERTLPLSCTITLRHSFGLLFPPLNLQEILYLHDP